MTDFMQNVYVILWGVLALLTFAVGIKQKAPYAFVISAFFVFMTVWYALDAYSGMDMFAGRKMTNKEPIIAMTEQIFNALIWERYLGINTIPPIYPVTIPRLG